MNLGTHNELPQESTMPPWLLPCACGAQRCHCSTKLKPDILCVIGHPYDHPPPVTLAPELTIQFIQFTYYNDRFAAKTLDRKTTNYQPLINNITTRGWNVDPLMVLVASARAATHIPSMNKLETILKLPIMKIKSTFKPINIIATQYAHSILGHN